MTQMLDLLSKKNVVELFVKNEGRKQMTNAKASLEMEAIDSEGYKWLIRRPLRWSEAERPSKTTINPSETIGLELFRTRYQSMDAFGEEGPDDFYYVEIPAEDDPPEQRLSADDRFRPPNFTIITEGMENLHFNAALSLRNIPEFDWETLRIEITGSNTTIVYQDLSISTKEDTVDVEILP